MTPELTRTTLPPAAMAAFALPGTSERWQAIQEHVHPWLVELAEAVQIATAQRYPQQWPLYEVSYKSQRAINRGHGERAPVDDYYVAFDRPPRGSGLLISVSGGERAILVGLQLWGVRKPQIQRLWEEDRTVWTALVDELAQRGEARFAAERRRSRSSEPTGSDGSVTWLERYLHHRQAHYLWAGFVYPWDAQPADLAARLIEDVLTLFPLNEALMEQAEAPERSSPRAALMLHEPASRYELEPPAPDSATIVSRIHARGLTISATLLRAYHVALQTRPLVILPGISGTGKTRLTRLYADAYYGIDTVDNPYYLIVAVQPDWHNGRDMLGYYNALTGYYQPTPFLSFVLRAIADPLRPYFVCLDEMNLARPEYYLAPLLSALETVERTVDLGIPMAQAHTIDGMTVAQPLRLPLNLRLIGTVNVDESTYPLSDKILDRANVIELTEVDMPSFRASHPQPIDEAVWQVLVALQAIVTRLGQPYGYRTLGDMLHYIEQSSGLFTPMQALDLQIKQRILPRLRGHDTPLLRQALADLLALLRNPASQQPLPESSHKVEQMLNRLERDGFTDFYGA